MTSRGSTAWYAHKYAAARRTHDVICTLSNLEPSLCCAAMSSGVLVLVSSMSFDLFANLNFFLVFSSH